MDGTTKSGWTLETYKEYVDALRAADERFYKERDRRYSEVSVEKEKALKIKETADLAALGLSRDSQTYKDEKANELREQISSERGIYATKEQMDTAIAGLRNLLFGTGAVVIGALIINVVLRQ